jgi:hypothetical protein
MGERSDALPDDKTPLIRSKKRSKGAAAQRDEFCRLLWHSELGRVVDPERSIMVFVEEEMGTHTSLELPSAPICARRRRTGFVGGPEENRRTRMCYPAL